LLDGTLPEDKGQVAENKGRRVDLVDLGEKEKSPLENTKRV